MDKKFIRLFRSFLFLVNFTLAKVGIYAVPLVIAASVNASVYGVIEFAWAVALTAASVMTGAQFGGINQRYLVLRDRDVDDELFLWTAIACGLAVVLWWGAGILGLPLAWQVAFASIGVSVIHNAASTRTRMRGERTLTAWADGTSTYVAGALVLSLYSLGFADSERALGQGYAVLAAGGAVVGGCLFFGLRRSELQLRVARSWKLGLPMLANALLATWLGVYGRVLVGLFAAEAIATYGLMFRVAGMALAVHQLAVTALFARLYAARTKAADQLMAPFLTIVSALLAILSLAAPAIVPSLPIASLELDGRDQFAEIFPCVALQVFFWIGFAMLQMRINRSGLATRAFRPMLLATSAGTFITLLIGWLTCGDLAALCWAIAAQSAALFWVEWYVLFKARLPHVRLGWIALIGGGGLAGIAIVNQIVRTAP